MSDEFSKAISDLVVKHWMRWYADLLKQCIKNEDGSLTVPRELARRIAKNQGKTFKDLNDEEQNQQLQFTTDVLDAVMAHGQEAVLAILKNYQTRIEDLEDELSDARWTAMGDDL